MVDDLDGIRGFRRSLRALERQVELSLAGQTECCGVTPAQCHVLLEVAGREGPSVADIALALELDASTLSRAVNGLVKSGFLLRVEDPADRRRCLVSLTKAGMKKVAEIDRACDEYYAGLLATLSERDRTRLADILPRFAEAMRAWRKECGEGCCRPPARGKKT